MPRLASMHVLFGPGLLLALGLALHVFPITWDHFSPIAHVRDSASLPATTICFDSNRTGNFEIYTMQNDGSRQARLATALRRLSDLRLPADFL
jgi:hypothetical protein